MLPSPFPPEIQDHIIDLLHSDVTALRACARTCRAWRTTSQYHLFNSITVTSEHILNRFAALIKTTRGGVIAYYVQELCITGPSSRQRVSHTWVSKVAQRLGPDLKNVHALQLRNVEWAIPHADWSIAVSFPSLVSLHIIACHFPSFDNFHDLLSTFTGFAGPALTHLSVDATGWKEASTKTPPKLNLPLQSLSIGRSCTPHVITNWLIAVNSHKRLRSVEFRQLDEDDLPEVAQLLRRLGTNLQHLKIGLQFSQKPYMLGELYDFIDLELNPNLRSLHLVVLSLETTQIIWVPTLLTQAIKCSLERIRFDIWLFMPKQLMNESWETVAWTLNHPNFNGLREVKFTDFYDFVELRQVDSLIRYLLPDTDSKDILKVTKHVL